MNSNPISRWCRRAVLLALILPWPGEISPALAQTSQMQQLLNRMERMQAELNTLQRQVYQGGAQERATGAPGRSGPQARKLTARMSVRITQLEDELRRLTGKTEEFVHLVQQMRARIEKLASDLEFRLSALERGTVATGAPPAAPGAAVEPGKVVSVPGSLPGITTGPAPGFGPGLARGPGRTEVWDAGEMYMRGKCKGLPRPRADPGSLSPLSSDLSPVCPPARGPGPPAMAIYCYFCSLAACARVWACLDRVLGAFHAVPHPSWSWSW